MKQITPFWRKMLAAISSIAMLSIGWLGGTGLLLLVAFVPLLWISANAEDSRKGWWSTFGWVLFTFVGWNLATIWWVGIATPIGPVAATIFSSFYSVTAFMVGHTISKRASKALAYTALVSLWIAFEYNYTVSEFSWPWLLLGNGFSNDIWAVQWYEFTGIFGGSLWVWLTNILIFEAYRGGVKIRSAAICAVLPLVVSVVMFLTYSNDESAGQIEVSVIQPNVDFYKRYKGRDQERETTLINMLASIPSTTDLVLMPETSIPKSSDVDDIGRVYYSFRLRDTMRRYSPNATLFAGMNTELTYIEGEQSPTARRLRPGRYYDKFNSAMALNTRGETQLRHKHKLVIGVENTPLWVFDLFDFLVIDIGGSTGQLGKGEYEVNAFKTDRAKIGSAICYEGLYGDFYGGFARDGAEAMAIISNDCWWGDTPGHRHLYTLAKLRAIETRRAIARCANTGTSGFIDARGVSIESLGWDEQGVISQRLTLNSKLTIYTRWGDYIARIACFVAALSILYYMAYRFRKRHLLVE